MVLAAVSPGRGGKRSILGLLGRLLGAPHGTLHFTHGRQALLELQVGSRVDIVNCPLPLPRVNRRFH